MKYKYHYTYRITNITKVALRIYYYGVHSTNLRPEDDLGIEYFSSSTNEEFKNDQKQNPHNYKYKIIRVFKTRKEATKLEIKLHEKFDVGVNDVFYNKVKQTSTGFDTTGKSFNIGRVVSKHTIDKFVKSYCKPMLINNKWTTKSKMVALKSAETMRKEILIDGNYTTIREEAQKKGIITNQGIILFEGQYITKKEAQSIKAHRTLKKKYLDEDGRVTSIDKENGKKISTTKAIRSRKFNILYKGIIILKNVLLKDVRKITNSLEKKTRNKYLGYNISERVHLNLKNKLHYKGIYVEEVSSKDFYATNSILEDVNNLIFI